MFVRNEGELIQVMQPIQKQTQINVGQHVTCIKAERERELEPKLELKDLIGAFHQTEDWLVIEAKITPIFCLN